MQPPTASAEYLPASQSLQSAFWVVVHADVWLLPAEHVVHAKQPLLPAAVLYVPVAHLAQTLS